MMDHDHVVAIGGSSGGLQALTTLLSQLPGDFPAPVLVVLHRALDGPSALPSVLGRSTELRVKEAEDGTTYEQGRVYVAVPDRHLTVEGPKLVVRHGPRENRTRPAVDPLFRSAARALGPRVIGVVLSGNLNDGTFGLMAIKDAGGTAMVQDPDDAAYPGMPRSALEHVEVDHRLPVSRMGAALESLVRRSPSRPVSETSERQAAVTAGNGGSGGNPAPPEEEVGAGETVVPFVCPDCGGPLSELRDDGPRQFRCRIGHRLTTEALVHGQEEAVEEALLSAIRTLDQRAGLLKEMAERVRSGRGSFEARAERSRRHSDLLRDLLEKTRG